jgi:hypothetical protein
MNATTRLTAATLIAATLAAFVLVRAPEAVAAPAQASMQIVRLPTVHVVAHRSAPQAMQVVRLPAVEIVVRRNAPDATLLAQKPARAAAL